MEGLWVNWVLTMLFLISPLDSITGNKVVDDRLAHTDLPGECCLRWLPHWPCLNSVWLPLSHHSQALKSLSSCTSFTLYHPPAPLFMSLSFPCAPTQPAVSVCVCVCIKFLWTMCVCVFSRRSTAPVHPLSGRLQKLLRPRRVQVPQYPGAALLQVNTHTHRFQDTKSSPTNNLITHKKQKKNIFLT